MDELLLELVDDEVVLELEELDEFEELDELELPLQSETIPPEPLWLAQVVRPIQL